jgi:hypothetical protein
MEAISKRPGRAGNRLWDWLELLALPLLLPTVIVPALAPAAAARMIVVEDTADESTADSPSPRQRAYATAEELQGDLSPGG